jgi:hypothetical protein
VTRDVRRLYSTVTFRDFRLGANDLAVEWMEGERRRRAPPQGESSCPSTHEGPGGAGARWRSVGMAVALAALAGACGGSSNTTTPTPPAVTVTEKLNGTVLAGGVAFHR